METRRRILRRWCHRQTTRLSRRSVRSWPSPDSATQMATRSWSTSSSTTTEPYELVSQIFDVPVDGQEGVTLEVPERLTNLTSYTWRARARDQLGTESEWSRQFTFRTNAENALPEAPIPLAPVDAILTPGSAALLEAQNAIDVDGDELLYQFEIYEDSELTQLVEQSAELVPEGRGGVTRYPTREEFAEGTYYWRVRARDASDFGAWSETALFRSRSLPAPDDIPTTDSGGCGCSQTHGATGAAMHFFFMLLGLLALRVRRFGAGLLAVLIACALPTGIAQAQGASSEDVDRAARLADEAAMAFEQGNFGPGGRAPGRGVRAERSARLPLQQGSRAGAGRSIRRVARGAAAKRGADPDRRRPRPVCGVRRRSDPSHRGSARAARSG